MIDEVIRNNPWTKQLKNELTPKRYKHTLRVAHTAYELAKVHHVDLKKAVVAGLLHDCAKNYSDKKLLKIAKREGLISMHEEVINPDLLHAKVGACEARSKYEVHDPDIYNAIAYHTTGRPSMSCLEKIIYIADFIEPNRQHHEALDDMRAMAFKDLDRTMTYILSESLKYLETTNKWIDPLTRLSYDYYKSIRPI